MPAKTAPPASVRGPGRPVLVDRGFRGSGAGRAFGPGRLPENGVQGKTCFLIEPPSPEALAARLVTLLDEPNALHAAAARAHEAWKEKFTLARYQRAGLEVIRLTQTRSATDRSI